MRFDGDEGRVECLEVDGIVEAQQPGLAGLTAGAVRPAATVLPQREWAGRLEAVALRMRADERALERGRARAEGHCGGRVARERLGGDEGQPAVGRRFCSQALNARVGRDLICARQAQRVAEGAGGQLRVLEDGRRVDSLVEGCKEDRRHAKRTAGGMRRLQRGRRRAEGPADRLCQFLAAGRLCARGDFDRVPGRHRHTVAAGAAGLEEERPRAHPAPAARQFGRQPDRHVPMGQFPVTGERNHRLVEGDTQLRGQRHVPLGRKSQNGQGRVGKVIGQGRDLRRRERQLHLDAGPGGRKDLVGQAHLLDVALLLLNGRQAVQQGLELFRRERCCLCEGRTRFTAVPIGLALAEREGRRERIFELPLGFDVFVSFVLGRFNLDICRGWGVSNRVQSTA